jgi:hypothetical protein
MSKMVAGDVFIWKGKHRFVFLEIIGRQYYFTCADYFGEDDAVVVCVPIHDRKHLVRA